MDEPNRARSRPIEESDSFGIVRPAGWEEIPLAEEPFNKLVRTVTAELEKVEPLTRPARRELELFFTQLRTDCLRRNVAYASSFVEQLTLGDEEDESTEETRQQRILAASCVISEVSRSSLGTDVALTAASIMAAVTLEPDATKESVSAAPTKTTDVEEPTIVALQPGEAVRLVQLQELRRWKGRHVNVPIFTQTYLVPIGSDGESAAIVSFGTPTVRLSRDMSELFDAMIQTFRVFSGDDVTRWEPTSTGSVS